MTTSVVRPRRAGEVVCLLLAVAVPVAGYAALYGSARYLWTLGAALVAGVLAAVLAVLVARGQGWRAFVGAGLGFAGVIAVAWLPARPHRGSGNPVSELVHGLSAIMTLNQPVDLANDVLILPFLLTAISTGLGLLALRSHSLLPLLPPGLALAVQLLLCAGYGGPVDFAWGMGVFTVAGVLLVGFRQRNEAGSGPALAVPEVLRLASIAVVVGVVAGTTAVAVAVAGPSRFDPRDRWHPADVRQQVTPLAFVRSDLTGLDDVRFSIKITGADQVQLIPVARLDVFDGTAWTADPQFREAGRVLRPERGSIPQIEADIEVKDLPTALLPQLGQPVELQRDGATGGSVLLDRASGMLLARSTPAAWAYTLLSTDSPSAAGTAPLPTTETCHRPIDSQIAVLQREWLPQQAVTAPVLAELATRMRTQLPYNPAAPAGSSLAAIQRVLSGEGPEHVGYAEQHAAAFAFLACEAGAPARVVVGYRLRTALTPGVPTTVTASDAHAWSEVYLDGTGWTAFDPTDPDKRITALQAGETSSTIPDSVTPPSSPPTPEGSSGPRSGLAGSWSRAQKLVSQLGSTLRREAVPLLVIALAVITAGLLALLVHRTLLAARRRRERAARYRLLQLRRGSPDPRDRVLGAWAVTTQLCREQGLPVRASSTPEEVAAMARGHLADPADCLPQLVRLANRALFGPEQPTDAETERAWVLADELLTAPARRQTVLVGGS